MRASALSYVLWAVALFGPGCVPINNTSDYVEMHGHFVDGHRIDQHLPASTGIVPSLTSSLGTVTALGAPSTGPDDLRGFHLEWIPSQVQSGMTYQSSTAGPAVFYIIGPDVDGGVSAQNPSVATGSITFSQVSGASRSVVKGTVSNIVLDAGDSAFITIDNGSFQATQP